MPGWMQDWWAAIALMLTVVVVPLIRWAARKGLASADDLHGLRLDLHGRVDAVSRAQADALAAVEMRLTTRLATLADWSAAHGVEHARLDGDLALVRQSLADLPRASQLADVAMALGDLRGDVRALGVAVEAVKRSVDQVDARVQRHDAIFADAARTRRERV